MPTPEEIRDRFSYHPPSDEGVKRHSNLTDAFCLVAEAIEESVPEGREKAVAFTHLETAKMWASAGVARNPASR